RIDAALKQRGYYNFNDGFLIFEADTNRYDNKSYDLYIKLKNEVPEKSIVPYRISKVNIYPDYRVADSTEKIVTRYEDKNFIQKEEYFKPKYLAPFVQLEEGELYN